jgi:Mn2+/Fe2+ NRAMP family transporter
MVTLAVMVCAYAAFYGRVEPGSLSAFADQLRPLLGDVSGVCFALGLLAAGLTSALTAPLAGAYVVTGIFGRGEASNHQLFRGTWVLILASGAVVASLQTTPLTAIIVAQYANGLLLPVLAMVLIVLARQSASDIDKTLGDKGRTLAAILVVGFCILLAVLKLG